MQVNRVWATYFQGLTAILNTAAKYTNCPMADMTACVGRVRNNGITATQPSQSNCRIRRVATDGTNFGLLDTKKFNDFILGHALNLVNIPCTLVITIDFVALVWMALSVTSHKIGVLHPPDCFAGSILTRNQVDGLRLSPGILPCYDLLNIANIYCHMYRSLMLWLLKYSIQYISSEKSEQ